MPKLLQIDSCLGILSTGRIAEYIAKIAKSQGWECYIIHGSRFVGKSEQIHYCASSVIDEYKHFIESLLFDRHGLGSRMSTKKVIKYIKEVNPDIIQLHCIHGYYINYKLLFEFISEINIPIVWTFHDCWAFTGHCSHFDSVNCMKWKVQCGNCPIIDKYPRSLKDNSSKNYSLKKSSFTSVNNMTIVPVSYWLENLTKQSFLNGYPTHVIHNGIDINIFKPTDSNIRQKLGIGLDDAMVLGIASEWGINKGIKEFIKLSREDNIKVVMVGVTDKIKRILPNNIVAIGRTNNLKELADIYSAADIFVNPTYNDSFPTVNLESIACGTPVITYRTGGSPEAIDNDTGYVVDQGDYSSLVLMIRKFMNLKFKEHHSEDCRNRALQYFDRNVCYEKYIKLYNKLLKNN